MKKYPRLKEMGVLHPLQIDRYSVNGMETFDVLRLVYERPQGSFLPDTRTYKFPRVQSSVSVGSDNNKSAVVLETNPGLVAALAELKDLLKAKQQKEVVTEAILEEIGSLEQDIALRVACIRDLIKRV